MDTTALGWAVQRTGAGREKAGEAVDPHAGIEFHAHRGDFLQMGQPFATVYATHPGLLAEPLRLIQNAVQFSESAPPPQDLVGRIFTRVEAEEHLRGIPKPATGP
jgi:pyrimidine-nucleoside phosphorylase